ncbi:DUF6233 domain-containing protein [Streptomyces sp. NPDC001852]|uniref:DUF6233 domain-containing protein n=1 Tax=Streptomyces sp. NPDC001852 TaxID=3364619 RepID=UPI00369530A6
MSRLETAGRRSKDIDQAAARYAVTQGVRACPLCEPDAKLGRVAGCCGRCPAARAGSLARSWLLNPARQRFLSHTVLRREGLRQLTGCLERKPRT